MKKRFLPISLLLVIMVLGQTLAVADQGGHYVPRTQNNDAESFMGSLRANQHTGLIDPADVLKAMQAPATRNDANKPLYWLTMGPDNMGGQTTAVLYDNRLYEGHTNGQIYIGSKGGGVYKSYNHGITWHQVGDLALMVSCMAQDADGVIYVGTGDGNNGVKFNGLDQQGYNNSFVGTGLYKLVDDVFELVKAPTEDSWLYINEIAVAGNALLVATNDGLMCSNDKGQNWTNAIPGNAISVKVGSDNTIVAVVENQVYIGSDINLMVSHTGTSTNMLEGDSLLPKPAGLVDIAIAPSNNNVIYVAGIDGNGNHIGVFVSEDKGETWATAFPTVTPSQGNTLYAGFGLYNHGIVVDPENEGLLYVLGYNLWSLTKPVNGGLYLASQINTDSYYYMPDYLHVGLHTMVFNPNNSQECYIGTDGGVFKGTGRFTFSNCNRNYVTSRMFNVAVSGKDTRILAAGLDHGTVLIEGDENTSDVNAGLWINPTPTGANDGIFNDDSHAGPCAISVLNPNTFFVTYKNGGLQRTATAGEDWVSTNFTSHSSLGLSTTSFRLPILLHEKYDNQMNPETAWFFNETGAVIPSGTDVMVVGANNFPFHYTLTTALAAGDSIEVHDPVTANFFVAFTDVLTMTRTPLQFNVEAQWYKVADRAHSGFTGEPLSMAITPDGDNMFVGMKSGRLFRVSGLNTVVDETSGTITDSLFAVTTTEIELPIDGQCITSVSVDPRNNNNVIVTCGNYGPDNVFVLYSTNAMADAPTFVSKQANLPKMPVYSSVIEMVTGDVIIGTERGIYRTKNITNPDWIAETKMMGEVPVMELKQQILFHETETIENETEEGVFVTEYPGVYNTGVIYAATYGRGMFRCENYKKEFASVPENNEVVSDVTVSLYPNPVSSQATVSFELNENCNVSYQVFDMTGRMVMNQNMGRMTEGEHQVNLNAENLSAGSYILRLNQGANNASVKFLVY